MGRGGSVISAGGGGFAKEEDGKVGWLPWEAEATWFHVECIDMWLSSHSNCPICRASIVASVEENVSRVVVSSSDHHRDELYYGGDHDLVEIVIESGGAPSSEIIREGDGNGGARTSVSVGSETSSSEFFGCSLERMLGKVFPSSNVN